METQPPLPNPPDKPNPDKPEFVRHGFHPMDGYIDQHRNVVHIKHTKLLATFEQTREYMEELHQRVIGEVAEKYRYGQRLARTLHSQLAAVVKRYLPVIEAKFHEMYPPLETQLEVTLDPNEPPELMDFCYQPITRHQYRGLMERERLQTWVEGIEQAEQVEARAKELVDKYNEELNAGNIQFVKRIDRGGSQFTKRAS